ncbi:NAD(P)/FAD-dependent oxidoreductase [Rhodococcus sp. WS4]|nr:NAD(P)/FAD-dependent oxidoreductase [Rhodococcus sp. WS4]
MAKVHSGVRHMRAVVIGSGFSGIAAAVELSRHGIRDFVVLERANSVGGVWRDNTYPGAACDTPSHLYSFSYAPNTQWHHTFARGGQIQQYLENTADKFKLRPHLMFGQDLLEAVWEEPEQRWRVSTANLTVTADILVNAAGGLTKPAIPSIPGLQTFPGEIFHSAQWDHTQPLAGKRVAVIGSGASAVQFVPEIQPVVESLTVFQRTPGWVLPRPDRRIGVFERAIRRLLPISSRFNRAAQWLSRDGVHFRMIVRDPITSRLITAVTRWHLRRQIKDPGLRAKLTPNFEVGCKRILLSNAWYPALAAKNVDVKASGLRETRGSTLVASDGTEVEADVIVFGTGFDVTPPPVSQLIHGRGGARLADVWNKSIDHYRATEVAGFPNLFNIGGPGVALGHGSLVVMLEAQADYLGLALTAMAEHDAKTIEVTTDAQDAFMDTLRIDLGQTVWKLGGCSSWYLDDKGDATTMWPGTMLAFQRLMKSFEIGDHFVEKHADETAEVTAT